MSKLIHLFVTSEKIFQKAGDNFLCHILTWHYTVDYQFIILALLTNVIVLVCAS